MTEVFKLLIIEDDKPVVTTIREKLKESIKGVQIDVEYDFKKAIKRIEQVEPDAVILDLIEGSPSSGNMTGNLSWQEIWNHRFVPLVVYTASSKETDPPLPRFHPFVVRISKAGENSLEKLVDILSSYMPYISLAREFTSLVSSQLQSTLRDASPFFWEHIDSAKRAEMFSRVLKRRVAALLDTPEGEAGSKLVHWEQFIVPPIVPHLLTGDILREIGANGEACASYRLVLSPSCDMVAGTDRTPKIKSILVAKCIEINAVWEKWSLCQLSSKAKEENAKKSLESLLTDQQLRSGILLIPEFPGLIPHMGVDLKELQLIDYDKIRVYAEDKDQEKRFERVLSIDSPFREAISWAYIQAACRPGLPDRQVGKWADELIATKKRMTSTN